MAAAGWRDTLFVWRGRATWPGGGGARVEWSGRWVGSGARRGAGVGDARAAPTPSGAAFAAAELAFEVAGALDGGPGAGPRGAELTQGRGWQLGEERAWHRDSAHHLMLPEWPLPRAGQAVFATGANEFGPFLSIGRLVEAREDEWELTLARRYLDPRDARAEWTPEVLRGAALAAGLDAGAAQPWRSAVLRAALVKRAGSAIAGGAKRARPSPEAAANALAAELSAIQAPPMVLPEGEGGDDEGGDGDGDGGGAAPLGASWIDGVLRASVEWEEQCWGCRSLAEPGRGLRARRSDGASGPSQPAALLIDAALCGDGACASRVRSELARATLAWLRENPEGRLESCDSASFWATAAASPSLDALAQAGWRRRDPALANGTEWVAGGRESIKKYAVVMSV
jgi:hypothetical protein